MPDCNLPRTGNRGTKPPQLEAAALRATGARTTQQAEIEAIGLESTNDMESAIFQTVAPGAYTAIVSGSSDFTGVELVKVYRLSEPAVAK